ncbi:MAG: hypothetical protein K2Y33_13445 [Mycolicibacterium frederiksbergense]|nr:hypothetical protein [Mycolicibacterium frederiksbergense]
MSHESTASDALKYAAALLRHRAEWTTDAIGGAGCRGNHEIELDAIDEAVLEIWRLAGQYGDPLRYSDGRLVRSSREIEPGVTTEHIWMPDPAAEEPRSWRGTLRHDPGEQCPGLYEVATTPMTQEIHVRVVRTL